MPRKKGYGGLKHHDHREAGAEHLPHYDGRQTGDKGGKLKHYDGRSKVKETSKQMTPPKTHAKNPRVGKLGTEKVKTMIPAKTHVDHKHHKHMKEHHKHVKEHMKHMAKHEKHLDGMMKHHKKKDGKHHDGHHKV